MYVFIFFMHRCIVQLFDLNFRSMRYLKIEIIIITRQVTCATHVRNPVCPRVELILKIIITLLIIFLGFIKSKPC